MKRISILIFISVTAHFVAEAQHVLTLSDCHALAEANYPLIRQRELIQKTKAYSVENASKGALPQIALGGQATYQSEVTQIPVEMPGVEPLSKDQYKVFAEVSQPLYQGGVVSQRKRMEETNAEVEEQKLVVELYQIRNRVNELFFGILLVQEQVIQSQLIKKDLQAGLKKVEASIANGTAIPSAADVIRAELLRIDQRTFEFESTADSYRRILGLLINQTVDKNVVLEKPVVALISQNISRPESNLFEIQKRSLEANEEMLSAARRPRIDLFVQGGYGRPGLNMLENEFNFYYLGGIRFSWLLSGYYTSTREKQIFNLRRQSLDVQKETFLFNTNLTMNQQEIEISKLRRLVEVDDEIIGLRTKVRETAAIQLEEGVITSTDFIREINAEDQAKQNRILHETQLLLAHARHHFTTGQAIN